MGVFWLYITDKLSFVWGYFGYKTRSFAQVRLVAIRPLIYLVLINI